MVHPYLKRVKYGCAIFTDPLHLTIILRLWPFTESLIQLGYSINTRDKNGKTILHRICKGSNLSKVRWLVEHGADVNARDLFGKTPLHSAASKHRQDIVAYLISKGADDSIKDIRGRTIYYKKESTT